MIAQDNGPLTVRSRCLCGAREEHSGPSRIVTALAIEWAGKHRGPGHGVVERPADRTEFLALLAARRRRARDEALAAGGPR